MDIRALGQLSLLSMYSVRMKKRDEERVISGDRYIIITTHPSSQPVGRNPTRLVIWLIGRVHFHGLINSAILSH